jgi:hypothetical protein
MSFFFFQGKINLNLGIMKYFKNNHMAHVNISWIRGNQFHRCKTKKNYSYESWPYVDPRLTLGWFLTNITPSYIDVKTNATRLTWENWCW